MEKVRQGGGGQGRERTTNRGNEADSKDGADHDDRDADVGQDLLRGEVASNDVGLARITARIEAIGLACLYSGKLDVLH